jgi:hypothetical protein
MASILDFGFAARATSIRNGKSKSNGKTLSIDMQAANVP